MPPTPRPAHDPSRCSWLHHNNPRCRRGYLFLQLSFRFDCEEPLIVPTPEAPQSDQKQAVESLIQRERSAIVQLNSLQCFCFTLLRKFWNPVVVSSLNEDRCGSLGFGGGGLPVSHLAHPTPSRFRSFPPSFSSFPTLTTVNLPTERLSEIHLETVNKYFPFGITHNHPSPTTPETFFPHP